jgi:two-component system sensor histidine kinase VicK
MQQTPVAYPAILRIGKLSHDGVFIYQITNKRFEYFNESFTQIFNVDTDSLSSQLNVLLDLIITEDQHYLKSRYKDLMENGCITSTEFRIRVKDIIKHISCDAYSFEEGTVIIGFVKDVTRMKEHENYIINYGARKDTLLDMVTHNLYGPLNLTQNIINNVQKTVKQGEFPDVQQQLRFIQDITKECIDIVNNFLRQEHLESEHIFVKKTRFDILEKIRPTLEKLVETNRDKNFHLTTHLDNLYITTDSVKFFQSLHNLVSNAIKFTHSGGNIHIVVDEEEEYFTVSVKDDGIGIPDELKQFIFQRQSHAGRTGLKGERSIGLGLPIVKTLVELMGGKLWFESEEGKGTTFFMRLAKE